MMRKQNRPSAVVGKALCSALVLLGLFSALWAQVRAPERPLGDTQTLQKDQQPAPTPLFDSKITLQFTFNDGGWFKVTQLEKGTITLEQDGSVYGFSPYLDGDQVKINAFRILGVKDAESALSRDVTITEMRQFAVGQKTPEVSITDLGLKVELLNITLERIAPSISVNSRPQPLDPVPIGDGGNCCVTCDGRRMCGCAVSSPCGGCCVGSCC